MYELLVLALLMHGPWHGYLITKFANEITGPWAKISPGSLYPLLSRLEQSGYIEALPQEERQRSPRQVHRYAITPAGRCRFHTLMMDTSSNRGDYPRIFHLKVMHFLSSFPFGGKLSNVSPLSKPLKTQICFVEFVSFSLQSSPARSPFPGQWENDLSVP